MTQSHIKRRFQIDPENDNLWDLHNKRCYSFSIYKNFFRKQYITAEPPSATLLPADVIESNRGLQVLWDERGLHQEPTITPHITTLRSCIGQLPFLYQQILSDLHIPQDEGLSIAEAIQSHQCIGSCDGSVKGKTGTFGYLLTNTQRTSKRLWESSKDLP